MAFSLNRITLLGNIGKDAETRFTTNNLAVTTFSLATTHSYKGKDGNWVNETTWHNIVAFNVSDFVKESLKKGKKIYVEGRLSNRSYEDKEQIKRYVTEVIADTTKLIPLDARDFSNGGNSNFETEVYDSRGNDFNPPAQDDDDLPF